MTAATELDVGLPSPTRRRSLLRYWRGNLKGSEFTWALAFSVPYIAVFLAFVVYPVFYGVWMGSNPALYADVFSDVIYKDTVVNTLLFVAVGVNLKLFLALLLSGLFMRPASRITVQKGVHFHTCAAIAEPSAVQRSFNHDGPSIPPRIQSALLSRPHSPFSIQWSEMKAGSCGTAQGSTNSISITLVNQPGRMKRPDSSSARNSLRLTPSTTKISVLTTVSW